MSLVKDGVLHCTCSFIFLLAVVCLGDIRSRLLGLRCMAHCSHSTLFLFASNQKCVPTVILLCVIVDKLYHKDRQGTQCFQIICTISSICNTIQVHMVLSGHALLSNKQNGLHDPCSTRIL